jgi:membrane protease YdiL (CAAX protease family)
LETDRIKLKTAGLSMAAILIIESIATLLNGHRAAPILVIGSARGLEIILLLGICYVTEPGGIKTLGILPKRIIQGLYKGFFWSAGFGLMVGLVAVILMITGLHPADLISANLPSTQPGLFFFFVVGGIISPVAEEIFFRGILYGYFRRWGMWAALLLSTAVFVTAHAIFHRVPVPQIVGGILFALSYEKEKNLMVPITIHVLGNLAIFTLALVR